MKYILVDKETDKKEEITQKEALRLVGNCYRNPKHVLGLAMVSTEDKSEITLRLRNFNLFVEK